ncbi:unnamed protein product [Rhizophagus irregularis]|nr:unnamed protein product [Rhizophagus irregularis]
MGKNENTTFCNECGIRWINNKFDKGKTKCKDCENDENEIDIRVKRLKQTCNEVKMEITEGELVRQQAGIEDSESSGNKSDDEESDESEKIGEILNPGEHENWDENIRDFEENESENEFENIINTGGFGLNQNSDSNNSLNLENSDSESELSDYNLQGLFQENIINMANIGQINRALENLFGLPPNALDAALGVGQIIRERIEAVGAETGGIVSMPIFSRTENEDVNDWVRQFDVAYTASGKPEGPVGGGVCRQRKANVAITCLKGAALQ